MSLLAHASVADLAPLDALIDPAYPEAWREVAVCLFVRLIRAGQLAPESAAPLALDLAEGLRAEIGGSQPYLPKGAHYEITQRDREIYGRFNGHNHDALARAYNLTPRQIYTIIERVGRAEFARRQAVLPGLDRDQDDDA